MANPVKRRATSVKHLRDDSRVKRVALATEQKSATFETVPLIRRLQDSECVRDDDDQAFKAGTEPCRLTSSATVRERRRCLSAEDRTHRPQSARLSRAPALDDSLRERCNSTTSTSRSETETSSSAVNFLTPSTTTTTVTPSSTTSSPARKARLISFHTVNISVFSRRTGFITIHNNNSLVIFNDYLY